MRALVFESPGRPLRLADVPIPAPTDGQVLVEVWANGICRTDLHSVDGELPELDGRFAGAAVLCPHLSEGG